MRPQPDARLWVSLQGRIGRKTFWLYFLVPAIVVSLSGEHAPRDLIVEA